MAKGDSYIGITKYLEKQRANTIIFSFEEVKGINGDHLPPSAYKHQAWWANTESHSHAFSWLNAGYKTEEVDLINQKVTFKKIEM